MSIPVALRQPWVYWDNIIPLDVEVVRGPPVVVIKGRPVRRSDHLNFKRSLADSWDKIESMHSGKPKIRGWREGEDDDA